jgi:hypothetical protein
VAVVVALAVVGAACSGNDDGGGGALDAAAAADALAAQGYTTRGTHREGSREGPVTGAFAPSGAARVRFPVFTGSDVHEVELLRTKDRSWLRRAVTDAPVVGATNRALVVATGTPPWIPLTTSGFGAVASLVTVPYEPVALLRALDRIGVDLERGDDDRTYTAEIEGPARAAVGGAERVRITVDGDGEPSRIRLDAGERRTDYRIGPERGQVDTTPPPDDEIQTAGTSPSSTATPTGAFAPVQTVDAGGTALTILRAPASDGGTCWKVEPATAYEPTVPSDPETGVCIPAYDPETGTLDEQVAFPVDVTADVGYELIGVLVPEGATVTLGFADGTRRPIPRDPVSGLAVHAGPPEPVAAFVQVQIGDTTVSCGPGPVTVPEDLADAEPAELPGGIWACQPVVD